MPLSFRARIISGKLNVIAEDLNKAGQILSTEWSLDQDMANHVFDIWGHSNMDLFMTRYNHKCLTFVSPIPDVRAIKLKALTIDWENVC